MCTLTFQMEFNMFKSELLEDNIGVKEGLLNSRTNYLEFPFTTKSYSHASAIILDIIKSDTRQNHTTTRRTKMKCLELYTTTGSFLCSILQSVTYQNNAAQQSNQ